LEGGSRVLVTGGAGFIGSHLVDRLLTEGFEVTILDNFSTGRIQNIESHRDREEFHLVRGDVTNVDLVRRVVDHVDAVLHEAASVDVELSTKDPLLFHEVNVLGTLNLLSACLNSDARRFILASSAAVYGDSKSTKKSEDMLQQIVWFAYCLSQVF
jgi:nucleoside-diphosphate-sugar epimerase